ncbi:hypothetical protein [Pelagibaculum spongiae]|uniref:Uncharacterized protein n=1 Tax=Pelagibaculum spongiae TaxID=2080658 RepID=A0A2V1GZT4_9GAMM|nr:hypothetical protein [Pelagibaculum spongiae]PVZ68912.1 hypothetical protein DC094_11710 [Pelagibaculum spongiae]
MRIKLKRQVTAICYQAVASVDVEQERLDVQKALEQVKSDFKRLPLRLVSYLEKEHLIENQQLTAEGEETYQTGRLASRERGIYRIWYLDNDEALGTRPLMLQREAEPVKGSYQQRSNFYHWPETERVSSDDSRHTESDEIFVIAGDKEYKKNIKNLNIEVINSGERTKKVTLDLEFEVSLRKDRTYTAGFKLGGDLPLFINNKQRSVAISEEYAVDLHCDFMNEVSSYLETEWDEQHQRMLSGAPDNKRSLSSFTHPKLKLEEIDTPYGGFDSGEVWQLPLMPEDRHEAEEWQKKWLNELYREDYFSSVQAQYRQQIWLSHPAVKHYELLVKSGKELLDCLDRQLNPVSFWHASAANYLIPQGAKSALPSIRLNKDDILEVSDLLRYLTLSEPVESIIYSDRHYKSSKHRRNMSELARLSGASFGRIFTTDTSVKLPSDWQRTVIKSGKDNHDRYWILTTTSRHFIWTTTTSLDFIDFSVDESKVLSPVTFTQIKQNDLPEYLQEALPNHEFRGAIA